MTCEHLDQAIAQFSTTAYQMDHHHADKGSKAYRSNHYLISWLICVREICFFRSLVIAACLDTRLDTPAFVVLV